MERDGISSLHVLVVFFTSCPLCSYDGGRETTELRACSRIALIVRACGEPQPWCEAVSNALSAQVGVQLLRLNSQNYSHRCTLEKCMPEQKMSG